MPIDKIEYKNLIPTIQFGNEEFKFYATPTETETMQDLFDKMFSAAMEQHKRNYPNLAAEVPMVRFSPPPLYGIQQPPEPEVLPVTVVEKGHSLEDDVRSCSEITVLKSYELLVKSNPILKNAYDETMDKLLTNKIITNGNKSIAQ